MKPPRHWILAQLTWRTKMPSVRLADGREHTTTQQRGPRRGVSRNYPFAVRREKNLSRKHATTPQTGDHRAIGWTIPEIGRAKFVTANRCVRRYQAYRRSIPDWGLFASPIEIRRTLNRLHFFCQYLQRGKLASAWRRGVNRPRPEKFSPPSSVPASRHPGRAGSSGTWPCFPIDARAPQYYPPIQPGRAACAEIPNRWPIRTNHGV